MHSATIFFAFAAVAAASAVGVVNDIYAHPSYKYSYGVADKHTGDQKSAQEVRDGGVTKGSYSLVQPDGVLRTVNYIVTPHGGFQAQVINKGVAGHPAIYGHHGHGVGIGHGIGAPGLAVGGLGLGAGIGGARSIVGGLGLGGIGLGGVGLGGIGLGGAGLGLGLGGVGLRGGLGLGAGIIG